MSTLTDHHWTKVEESGGYLGWYDYWKCSKCNAEAGVVRHKRSYDPNNKNVLHLEDEERPSAFAFKHFKVPEVCPGNSGEILE